MINVIISVVLSVLVSVIVTFINNTWHIKQMKVYANIPLALIISIVINIIVFGLMREIDMLFILPLCLFMTVMSCYIRCSIELDNSLR